MADGDMQDKFDGQDDPTDKSVFQDEQGSWSFARVALAIVLINILALVWYTVRHQTYTVDNAVWTVLTSLAMGLMTWSGGARIAQYISGPVSGIATAISTALQRKVPDPAPVPPPTVTTTTTVK